MPNNKDSKLEKNNSQSNNKNSTSKRKKSKYKTFFKRFFLFLLTLTLLCVVVASGYIFAIIKSTPELDVNQVLNLSQPSMVYDNKKEFIDDLPTEQIRYKVNSEDIPQNLKDAFVAIEDERFYEHKGIDIKRILGALYRDAIFFATGKGGLQGASTLTQQLIKNTLLTNETTIERKVKEIYLSLNLEKHLTKDQVLVAYLNTIPLGGLVYGVEAASYYYFEKPANKLTLPECAFLAGLTQAPTSYSPYNPANHEDPSRYINRTNMVLSKMKQLGFITENEFASAHTFVQNNEFPFPDSPTIVSDKINYESFVYATVDQVKKDLKEKYKYTDEEISKKIGNGGLKIYSTMDRSLQDSTQSILNDRSNIKVDANKGESYDEFGTPKLQASAVITDYRTGQVKALVGGRGTQPPRSLNRAYDSFRSIASTTKPLTIYGPAIDTKMYTAATPIDDSGLPKDIHDKYPGWKPKNWDGSMAGYINMRDCLAESKNVPSIMVTNSIGTDTALSYGEKLGLKYHEESKGLATLSLGEFTGGDGGNTYTLSSAYGVFGNNGIYVEPKLYTEVLDSTGKVLLEASPKQTQVFSPQTAFIMQDLLKKSANDAQIPNMPVVGKTGTSEYVKDFWFAGITPYYSGSVWIGYDTHDAMTGYSSAAANLWAKIMTPAHNGLERKEISERPSGIVNLTVCKDSGKRATSLCSNDPRGNRVSTEMFIEGTEPTGVCDVHVTARVNKENNKLATEFTPAGLIVDRVFIKKPNANPNAADYKYVYPTQKDDTKYEEPKKEEKPKEEEKPKPDENKPEVTPPPVTPPTTPTPPPTDENNGGNNDNGGLFRNWRNNNNKNKNKPKQ